jgi:hypothetical protein
VDWLSNRGNDGGDMGLDPAEERVVIGPFVSLPTA